MSTFYQTSVLNGNTGDTRDLLYVSQGNAYVAGDVTNNATNKGFLEAIPWSGIRSYQKIAYAAGVQKSIKINFNSSLHGFVANGKYEMVIKFYDPVAKVSKQQRFIVYAKAATLSPAVTIERQVANQFFAALNNIQYPWTVTQSTYVLTIAFAIGTTATNATEPTIEMDWVTADTAHAITGIADSSSTKVTITSAGHGLAVGDMVNIYGVTWTADVLPTAGDFKTTGYQVTDTGATFKVAFAIASTTYASGGFWKEVVQMTSTAYVKAQGTPSLVNLDAPTYGVTGKTYTTYVIDHMKEVRSDYGLFPVKPLQSVIYVENALTEVIAYLDALLSGVVIPDLAITAITKAILGVVTAANHCLKVGDRIIFSQPNLESTVSGLIVDVAEIVDENTFKINFDTGSWTDAETGCIGYIFQPSKYYLGV